MFMSNVHDQSFQVASVIYLFISHYPDHGETMVYQELPLILKYLKGLSSLNKKIIANRASVYILSQVMIRRIW